MSVMNKNPSDRERSLQIAAMFCLVDLLLTGGATLFSNSLTILSDLFKEGADFFSVLFALITIKVVNRNPDEKFTYGIGKLENLVSIGVALLMILSAGFILFQAITRFQHPEHPHGTLPGIAIFSCSAVFGFRMFLRNRKLLHQQKSAIVASQVRLWFAKAWLDTLMASVLIVSIVLDQYAWSAYLDPLASLVGVGFLIHGAWEVSTSSVHDLLDASLEEASQLLIMKRLVEHFDEYESVIKIRTRRSGIQIYIEVFLGFNPKLTLAEVQKRVDQLSSAIRSSFPSAEVVVVPSAQKAALT
jgi:cation diffusion facilitator family transporter